MTNLASLVQPLQPEWHRATMRRRSIALLYAACFVLALCVALVARRRSPSQVGGRSAATDSALAGEFTHVDPLCVPRRLSAADVQVGAEIARHENAANRYLPGYDPELATGTDSVVRLRLRGAVRSSRYWRSGRTLTVRMLNGSRPQHAQVMSAAAEWGRAAGLRFVMSSDSGAQIRVRIVATRASWSYLGTDALLIPPHRATMQLGGITSRSSLEFVRSVALHGFGHVLGFVDQHLPPSASERWDSLAIQRALRLDGTDDTDDQLAGYLAYVGRAQRDGPRFDSASVMLLPVPRDFRREVGSRVWRRQLSSGDSVLVRAAYRP